RRPASPLRQRPEPLHHEYALVRFLRQALERRTQLPSQRFHHLLVRSEHLRTQAVGHYLEVRVLVEPREEFADLRNEIALERIQADLDPDVHDASPLPLELYPSIAR